MRHVLGELALRAALLAALLVLVAAPAAHAERSVVLDPAGDVWPESGDGAGARDVQPVERPDADVRRVVLSHDATTFVVEVRLGATAGGGVRGLLFADLRTDAGGASVTSTYTGRRVDDVGFVSDASGATCPDARLSIRPGAARVRLEVPRSCLGDPRWVQARVATGSIARTFDYFVDIAGTPKRADGRVWSERLRVG